jgi:two-component system NtrC family sensor kinase
VSSPTRAPDSAAPEAAGQGEGEPLLRSLLELQTDFLRGGDRQRALDRWLTLLLEETGGEPGLLGVECHASGAAPQRQVLASHPPGWVDARWELPGWRVPGDPQPRSLQSLVAWALETGQPVSAEGAMPPPGSPPLSTDKVIPGCFRILPLLAGDTRVGFVGFTHRSGRGIPQASENLRLLLSVGGGLLRGWHGVPPAQAPLAAPPVQAEVEKLRQTLASVEEDLWLWNPSTQELRMSRNARARLGYAEGEVEPTFEGWKRLCHPEDLPRIEHSLRELVAGTTPHAEFEYRARSKKDEWAWFRSRARVAARDEQGRPTHVVGTDTDLTSMKGSEERLSALLQAIPDLIFRQREDGTLLDFSCSTAEMTLLRPEDFIGRNMRDLTSIPQHLIDLTFTQLERVLRDGIVAVYDYELDMPFGRQSYEARMVRSGPNEAVSIIRNVTDRRLVEERQAQLIQAEKLASLGQMAAGLAHEINNPVSYVSSNLRALEGYALAVGPLLRMLRELVKAPGAEPVTVTAEQLARMRQLWEQGDLEELLSDMPELIQESLTGTRRIKEIANSLRSFAREDDGKPQPVELNEELESTLRMVWNELKYKCEVKRDFGQLPRITGFPTQLVQVFTNLLLNAAHAIESRGEIHIRTRQEGEEVVVEISDTGKGMTEETLSKLFTPFFTTKPRGQGTGLGLSISRDIVTRHGGRITVRSQPGQGSTFTLYLPISPP